MSSPRLIRAVIPTLNKLLCLGLLLLLGCPPPVPRDRDLLLATASVGGTFYPMGVAMATLISRELEEPETIIASAITSSGSAENIRMLELDEAQLAIVQSLFASLAWQGEGIYQGREVRSLRGIGMLWRNVEQIVLRSPNQTDDNATVSQTLTERKGDRISLGPRWSGAEISGRTILGALGFSPDEDFHIVNLGYGPSADALQNRRIDGMFLAGGIPTAAVTQAMAGLGRGGAVLLSFSDEELATLRDQFPVWERYVIPAETYPGQTTPIPVIAQPNLLITSEDVSEEVIYHVTRTIWENLEYLHRQHAAAREMSLDTVFAGMPIPLHPGAVRYFREVGLEVPDDLLPPELTSTQEKDLK